MSETEAFRVLRSRAIVLAVDNIDTDQIIPARYLTTTTASGLGEGAFADWRYDRAGNRRNDTPLNAWDAPTRRVLIAGDNFGCGSSREHAPWALTDFGFRAVISTSFADIFRSNALKNGLLAVQVPAEVHAQLLKLGPQDEVTVDLERCVVFAPGVEETPFEVEPFARTCLLQGVDQLGFLTRHLDDITAFEAARDAA